MIEDEVSVTQLIETAYLLRIIPRRMVTGCHCEITACVSKKNNFFVLVIGAKFLALGRIKSVTVTLCHLTEVSDDCVT